MDKMQESLDWAWYCYYDFIALGYESEQPRAMYEKTMTMESFTCVTIAGWE